MAEHFPAKADHLERLFSALAGVRQAQDYASTALKRGDSRKFYTELGYLKRAVATLEAVAEEAKPINART